MMTNFIYDAAQYGLQSTFFDNLSHVRVFPDPNLKLNTVRIVQTAITKSQFVSPLNTPQLVSK